MNLRKLHKDIASLAYLTKTEAVLTNVDDDDCAVIKMDGDTGVLVATTDFINSSPAMVELENGSWYNLGQLVVCHNLADLAGSGCAPRFFMSGICAPHGTTHEELLEFIQGVCDVCQRYNCALIGGDTKFGRTRSIYGTALGIPFGSGGAFLRTQAKPGYKLVVSGCMGSFGAAVVCLSIGPSRFSADELSQAREIIFRIDVPFVLAEHIASFGHVCAGTDISDGLGTDINDICSSSSVSATIMETAIPVDNFTRLVASRLDVPAWSFAFASGGDFACAFAVPSDIADTCTDAGGSVIGQFEHGPARLLSGVTGRPLFTEGHLATRTQTFADEILTNIFRIKEYYGS
ncbi:MAG: thiamine-phosphate kinase [Methylobacter sp.]